MIWHSPDHRAMGFPVSRWKIRGAGASCLQLSRVDLKRLIRHSLAGSQMRNSGLWLAPYHLGCGDAVPASVSTLVDLDADQAIAYRNENCVGSIIGVELAQYGADVILNRLLADTQDIGDALV